MTKSEEFAEAYLPMIRQGLIDVFEREEKEKEFLNQDNFINCVDRARAGIYIAVEPAVKTLGLNIANSREEKYSEDHSVEKAVLSADSSTDVKVGKLGFWNA